MKKTIFTSVVLLFLALTAFAQEQQPTQKKKEKAKKECNVNGQKCCASEESKGCDSTQEKSEKEEAKSNEENSKKQKKSKKAS